MGNDLYSRLPDALLCWVDVEFTGLDPETSRVLEIAIVVTTSDLSTEILSESFVCLPKGYSNELLSLEVQEMHKQSGLLYELESASNDEEETDNALLAIMKSAFADTPLIHCGYYLQLDREILARRMPQFFKRISFRMLDLRSLEEAAESWIKDGRFTRIKSKTGHRALSDVYDSIALALKYKKTYFTNF